MILWSSCLKFLAKLNLLQTLAILAASKRKKERLTVKIKLAAKYRRLP
jgi:hypothetical protein